MFTRFADAKVNPQQTARERNHPIGLTQTMDLAIPAWPKAPAIRPNSQAWGRFAAVSDRPILGMLGLTGASIQNFFITFPT
jgi:hypothetical protein